MIARESMGLNDFTLIHTRQAHFTSISLQNLVSLPRPIQIFEAKFEYHIEFGETLSDGIEVTWNNNDYTIPQTMQALWKIKFQLNLHFNSPGEYTSFEAIKFINLITYFSQGYGVPQWVYDISTCNMTDMTT